MTKQKTEQKIEQKTNNETLSFIESVFKIGLNNEIKATELSKKANKLYNVSDYTDEKAQKQLDRIIQGVNKKTVAKWKDYKFEVKGKGKDKIVKLVKLN